MTARIIDGNAFAATVREKGAIMLNVMGQIERQYRDMPESRT
ncbi:hypothetical protein [Maritimibacter sp. 55A14]|nr:hypothetical protein [Maritimibacter sp. 55A14]